MVKKMQGQSIAFSPGNVEARVRKAEKEGRSQQALDLAKQLYKQEPTPHHKDLLRRIYLSRARHLRQQGYTNDASTVLEAAVEIVGDNNEWLEKVVEELATCGSVRYALKLLDHLPDSPKRSRIFAVASDQAVRQGAKGRNLLPPSLQGQFDRILQAFSLLETGDDDQARDALQEVGLQSPFLEWKLMIRGLAAYYQNEDARALENWQRLTADRLPARLVAPMRFEVDADFRVAQDPRAQNILQKQIDRAQDPGPIQSLRAIQKALSPEKDDLGPAFRLAETVVPVLWQSHPQLIPRLASCFYWSIVALGKPDDMSRYTRIFGPPADDPDFSRLQALVMERVGQFTEAHTDWQRFESSVANHPQFWPGDLGTRVRALIWSHMGSNAAMVPNEKKLAILPRHLRDHPLRPKALIPGAEECFQKSIELAPDRLEPYQKLFNFYRQEDQTNKAEQAARQLLTRFPDHVSTRESLGELLVAKKKFKEGVAQLEKAHKTNPLDRKLRSKLSHAQLCLARDLTEKGDLDEARGIFRENLELNPSEQAAVLCKWAACEFIAGDAAKAEELHQQALAKSAQRLPFAYRMLIEAMRFNLAKNEKARFAAEFESALADPPTAEICTAIADTAGAHRLSEVKYSGQKTHEKRILSYLEKARRTVAFSEEQLQRICKSMLELAAIRQTRNFCAMGHRQFPRNPYFPYLEAQSHLATKRHDPPAWKVKPLLEIAAGLARVLPQDEDIKALQEQIQEDLKALAILNPYSSLFQSLGDELFGFAGSEWEAAEDEYEGEDWIEEDAGNGFFDRPRPRKRRRGR